MKKKCIKITKSVIRFIFIFVFLLKNKNMNAKIEINLAQKLFADEIVEFFENLEINYKSPGTEEYFVH